MAERTSGRSFWLMSCTHSLADSARWSNWPGRYSTANTAAPSKGGSLSVTLSDCGSEKTVGTQAANVASSTPSTS